ncbi:MAG: radical SAM family heme chaperone HemW [Calditrichaeota bacterium]|nr:radical SAM family heme chaperone HemW [Calditrichota bacterium]
MTKAALYIHVPFCKHKCNYCDFYSITDQSPKLKYINALQKEIKLYEKNPPFGGFSFSTLYFGGGTPSLLSPRQVEKIISLIRNAFPVTKDIEISLEANPGTLESSPFKDYLNAGINRLTIGTQSFNDRDLKFLTRIHSAAQAEKAILSAQKAGFQNIGIDLIFALPGQTLRDWENNLRKAIRLKPQHISMYGLTFEEGTPLTISLRLGKVEKCSEELERQMYLLGKQFLQDAGYEHYEISSFALPGFRSRHNQKYWDDSPYLGLGPSAHSYNGRRRQWNVADVSKYLQHLDKGNLPIENEEEISQDHRKLELLLLGLRRVEGINLKHWQKQTGCSLTDQSKKVIEKMGGLAKTAPFSPSSKGRLLTIKNGHLCLTREGLLLYDTICMELAEALD